ncbi:HNH endonuclease [Chryseobacterium indologenes]|uniref:HNH endonuclease n=1 Tax=Chryseobacterium indologenes TaxID=253 RepID=A0AAD0Z074_CHRID|nr:HNH endonuclease signature motif containing protein [Chryseobacterium indologenes]AYZ36526.1 HNH endonuclease [Chryseobacterium indologenes]AZB20331.1 HNH endonuclease [Chryseobacterium indologenes]MBF6645211.1 HNH endonuclease [Chryseobacterium indologenes]MBU3049027.1 HNH endonuclease [Chryseobacterium indologenes]MEB4759487.1 HNH endonuclease signature motif containing protein [Chryseobacterium indologenes]
MAIITTKGKAAPGIIKGEAGIINAETQIAKAEAKLLSDLPKPPKGKGSVLPADRDPARVYTKTQKTKMLEKQNGLCIGCGEAKTIDQIHGHHVIRHADGGATTMENGVGLCHTCHKQIHK